MNLDILLIQLNKQATPKWREFANIVGLSNMVKHLEKYYSDDESIIEICDQWLKSHPTLPTWSDVADVVKQLGLSQLSEDLLKAYETGSVL